MPAHSKSSPRSARPAPENLRAGGALRSSWIVSPRFDLLFLINAWWIAAFLPGFLGADRTPHIEFWQIYFLTTPHRWITLFLVAADPDRRGGRTWLFVAIAVVAAAVVGGVRLLGGGFICLLLIDYVWNAWHFAAQHAGVLRMYARKAGGGRPRLETWAVRLLVFYASIRLAGWSTGWAEPWAGAQAIISVMDVAAVVPATALLIVELLNHPLKRLGKVLYLASVVGLYTAMLAVASWHVTTLVLSLTGAAAAFHAVEYLAIVSHYADRRKTQGSAGAFRNMAAAWGAILGVYIVLLGLFANFATLFATGLWQALNLWAAAVHYAYDGLIWKLRTPQTAATLGVEINVPTAAADIRDMPSTSAARELLPTAAGTDA